MDQQTSIETKQTIEWLNHLIMLAQWNRKLPFHTVRLIRWRRPDYLAFLTLVRASASDRTQLSKASMQIPETNAEVAPLPVARKKLLEAVAAVPALQQLFGSDKDPFAGAPPNHLDLLAEVSDVTADSQKLVYSRCGTLEAVIAGMRTAGELDPDQLIVNDLNKFLTLLETEIALAPEKSTAELLYDLAVSPNWYIVMASLRAGRDYTDDADGASAVNALTLWREKIAKQTLQHLLLNPGHLSRAPKKLITLAWEHRDLFAEARAKIPENAREKHPDDERKQVANSAFLLFEERFRPQIDEIRNDLKVLATVANHFVNVRKFAKFDGLVYTWPEIARLGRVNYAALKYVEELLLNRMPRPSDADLDAREARELYMLIDRDDRLKRFLRLRPHFREISENELMQYRPLAPVVVANRTAVSGVIHVSDIPVLESVDFQPQPQPPSPAPPSPSPAPPSPALPRVLQVQTLTLERTQALPAPDKGLTYDLNFSMLGKTVTGTVTFQVEKLLERILSAMGVNSDSGLQEVLKELFASDASFAEERIRRGSVELATNILDANVEPLAQVLSTPPSLRLVVSSTERDIHYLPWEWWPTSMSTLLLSSPDQSVIRAFKSTSEDLPNPMLAPLRLMSVIPNMPQGTRFTSDITIKALKELTAASDAHYRPLIHDEAGMEKIASELKSFKPHIVHLETKVVVPSESADYGLSVLLSGSPYDLSHVDYFATALRNAGVQLVVIGRNDVSRLYENAWATAAFQLAKKGLSVIAPMRAIDDASATTFTTEFYRAFLQGNKLEPALHLARRNLAAKGGDWTVFALFTDPNRIQYLELVRESA